MQQSVAFAAFLQLAIDTQAVERFRILPIKMTLARWQLVSRRIAIPYSLHLIHPISEWEQEFAVNQI